MSWEDNDTNIIQDLTNLLQAMSEREDAERDSDKASEKLRAEREEVAERKRAEAETKKQFKKLVVDFEDVTKGIPKDDPLTIIITYLRSKYGVESIEEIVKSVRKELQGIDPSLPLVSDEVTEVESADKKAFLQTVERCRRSLEETKYITLVTFLFTVESQQPEVTLSFKKYAFFQMEAQTASVGGYIARFNMIVPKFVDFKVIFRREEVRAKSSRDRFYAFQRQVVTRMLQSYPHPSTGVKINYHLNSLKQSLFL